MNRRLAQTPLQSGQAALAQPTEMPPDARHAFKPERFDRFATNVPDGLFDRISRVDQA
jgi:hypothetical protein